MKRIIILTITVCVGLSVFGINPAVLVSENKTTYTSGGIITFLTDNLMLNTSSSFTITNGAWVAINLEDSYQEVFFNWNSPEYSWSNEIAVSDECDQTMSYPVDYTIAISSNSTNGTDGTWTVVKTITNNTLTARGHLIDMNGADWIKMSVTQGEGSLNELQVFDIANGGDDIWFFTGTSISANTYKGTPPANDYAKSINTDYPSYTPAMIRGGIPCSNSSDFANNISTILTYAEGAKYWAIELGMSDGWEGTNSNVTVFSQNLQEIVDACQDKGIEPIFARPPATNSTDAGWQLHEDLLEAIDNIVTTNSLIEGPDLYNYFLDNQSLLGDDGIHPTEEGAAAIHQLWAEKMSPLYGNANKLPVVEITSPLDGGEYQETSTVVIQASAEDTDGTVESIALYLDGSKIVEYFTTSIKYEWSDLSVGEHTIAVTATDDAGAVSLKEQITINVLEIVCPLVKLDREVVLCKDETISLEATVSSEEDVNFLWYKDGSLISGENGPSLDISEEGVYKIAASKTGCSISSADIIVKNGFAEVQNVALCKAGTATLEVFNNSADGFNWYDSETEGILLDTGKIYKAEVEESTTFWIANNKGKDRIYLGLEAPLAGAKQWALAAEDLGEEDKKVALSVEKTLTLDAVSLYNPVLDNDIVVRLMDASLTVLSEHTINASSMGITRVPIGEELSPGEYIIDLVGTEKALNFMTSGGEYPYVATDYIAITPTASWVIEQGWYGLYYNWEFSYGNNIQDEETCPRVPVTVTIDPEGAGCTTDCNGDVGGTAYLDDCNVCVGGNTGLTECVTQTITLSEGWNLISVYVQAENMSVESILGNSAAVNEIKSADAFWIAEDIRFNSLTEFEIGTGYFVHATEAVEITLSGSAIEGYAFMINEGVNMIGVPFTTSIPIDGNFPAETTTYIKDVDGAWTPDGINSLEELTPGVGYFIEATSSFSVELNK